MSFAITCPCGKNVLVKATDAGSVVVCGCGEKVNVPSLSVLRTLQGKNPYEANAIDTINRMIKSGELPAGTTCAISGRPTNDVFELDVQTEQIYAVDDRKWYVGFALLFGLGNALLLYGATAEPGGIHGRDMYVITPLRVSLQSQAKLRRAGQDRLKRWLRSIPIYAQLLKEYPKAQIILEKPEIREV